MWEGYEEYEEYVYIEKNHPHFCPRKNGDSCRPVLGFYRLKRELHARIVIPLSPPGLLRLFPCSLLVSVFIVFLLASLVSVGFALSSSLAGAVFIVFPCPSLIVFSSFSLTSCAAFPCFCGFPFVSLPVVACRWAVRCCFPPVPVP